MNHTNYFQSHLTRQQIRDEYRRLAKIHHPDLGGNTADMQQLNAAYEVAMDAATRAEMPNRSEASYTHQRETNERIRQAIETALRFKHLTIEICGWWVWIHGSVKGDAAIPHLKAAGYKWAPKKQQWYYPGIPSSNRQEKGMEDIRARHGSEFVSRKDARAADIELTA